MLWISPQARLDQRGARCPETAVGLLGLVNHVTWVNRGLAAWLPRVVSLAGALCTVMAVTHIVARRRIELRRPVQPWIGPERRRLLVQSATWPTWHGADSRTMKNAQSRTGRVELARPTEVLPVARSLAADLVRFVGKLTYRGQPPRAVESAADKGTRNPFPGNGNMDPSPIIGNRRHGRVPLLLNRKPRMRTGPARPNALITVSPTTLHAPQRTTTASS